MWPIEEQLADAGERAPAARRNFQRPEIARDFSIPLPPLEEQRRIVAVLEEAFEGLARARANIEANLADAEEVLRRHTDALLTGNDDAWIETTVGELCQAFEYGTSSKSLKVGEIPVIRMGNIQNGRVILDNLVYSDNEEDNRRYQMARGDVLFNRDEQRRTRWQDRPL